MEEVMGDAREAYAREASWAASRMVMDKMSAAMRAGRRPPRDVP